MNDTIQQARHEAQVWLAVGTAQSVFRLLRDLETQLRQINGAEGITETVSSALDNVQAAEFSLKSLSSAEWLKPTS